MLKSYEAIYDHGQLHWLAEHPATRSAPDHLAGRLPVHTPELSPGTIESRRFPKALRRYAVFFDRPLFLIGAIRVRTNG